MAYSRYAHDDNGRYDTLANGIFAHSDRGPAAQLVADQVELVVERLQPNRVGVRTGGNAGQIVFDTSLFAAQLGDVPHSLAAVDLCNIIPACVARALHPAVRADGTPFSYARSFITCDDIHFRTIFFSPGDRSPMGRGKDGVIYCMDSLGGAAGWGSTANAAVLVQLRGLAATHNWAVEVSLSYQALPISVCLQVYLVHSPYCIVPAPNASSRPLTPLAGDGGSASVGPAAHEPGVLRRLVHLEAVPIRGLAALPLLPHLLH
jgi:hypothetical protein